MSISAIALNNSPDKSIDEPTPETQKKSFQGWPSRRR